MAIRLHAFAFLLIAAGGASRLAALERDEVLTFSAGPRASLSIASYGGNITVITDNQPDIRVRVFKSSATTSTERFDDLLRKLTLEVTSVGETHSIRASFPGRRASVSLGDWPPVGVAFEVRMPRHVALTLATDEGDLNLGEVAGAMDLRSDRGTIFCRLAEGPLKARTARGDIVVSRALSDLDLRTEVGAVRVGSVSGRATLENRSGDIDVLVARGGIVARAEAGDVEVGFPRQLAEDSRVETSGGSIRLLFDPESSAVIDASSVWGKVISKLPLTVMKGALDSRRCRGQLNQRGPAVEARANGGYVRIESRPEAFAGKSPKNEG